MGKNSNAHKSKAVLELDLLREKEENERKAKKAAKFARKDERKASGTTMRAAAMDVDGSKAKKGAKALFAKKASAMTGISKKGSIAKKSRQGPHKLHQRQMERLAKSKEMQM